MSSPNQTRRSRDKELFFDEKLAREWKRVWGGFDLVSASRLKCQANLDQQLATGEREDETLRCFEKTIHIEHRLLLRLIHARSIIAIVSATLSPHPIPLLIVAVPTMTPPSRPIKSRLDLPSIPLASKMNEFANLPIQADQGDSRLSIRDSNLERHL